MKWSEAVFPGAVERTGFHVSASSGRPGFRRLDMDPQPDEPLDEKDLETWGGSMGDPAPREGSEINESTLNYKTPRSDDTPPSDDTPSPSSDSRESGDSDERTPRP